MTGVVGCKERGRQVDGPLDHSALDSRLERTNFMSHHAERISLSVVRGVNRAIRSHLATLSARLARA